MADADLGNATFRITGDASGARNASYQAMSALGQLEQIVNTNWWGLQNLALAFSALPAAVAVGVGAAVSAAMQWEDAMAGVGKTTSDSNKSIEENDAALASLSDELLELATTKPIAPIELAGIAEELGALGVAQDDIASATDVVADFVATTDVGAEQASSALARLAGFTGLPVEGYRNIASAVLEAGRSTAATESQIVAIANRIQGTATTFDLSAQSIIGWAAAMATAGIAPELAGTNFQKTFIDIQGAISKNGEELQVWAELAQSSASEFASAFEEDPSNAMQNVITGLADMQRNGQNVYGTLAELGITEQRQIRLLTTLAGAQNSVSSENLKLSTIMETSNEAFAEGNALAEIADRRYNTVSGQLQILKNEFFQTGTQIGTVLLPALQGVIGFVSDMLVGFRALPGPLQAVMAITLGVVTVFSALAAAVFLLLPRLILAQQSFRQLVGAYKNYKTELQSAAGAERAAVLTKQELAAASIAAAQAQIQEASTKGRLMQMTMALSAAEQRAAVASVTFENARFKATQARLALMAAEQQASQARIAFAQAEQNAQIIAYTQPARAAQLLEAAKARLLAADQALIRARVELSVAESQQARASNNSAASASVLANAQRNLALATDTAERAAWENVLAQERMAQAQNIAAASADNNAAAQGRQRAAMGGAGKAAALLGAAMAVGTFAMFRQGKATNEAKEEVEDFAVANEELVDAMMKGNRRGRDQASMWISQQTAAAGLRDTLGNLGISFQDYLGIIRNTASEDEAAVFWAKINQGIAEGVDGSEELKGFVDQLTVTYAGAVAQARILGATTDDIARVSGIPVPESNYGRSIEEVEEYREGVYDLLDAQDSAQDAAGAVEEAEEGLAEARRRAGLAANYIQSAELELRRSRLNQSKAADDIRSAERDLATARRRQAREVLDAERSLSSAQARYRDSVRSVQDIEEQLAEARRGPELNDMLKATVSLAEAQKSLRDANQSVADSQWYLNYLREEGAGSRDIREGEDALSDARLDVQNATAGLSDAEKELRDLQNKNKQAEEIARLEEDLADARRSVADASFDVADAEEELSEARRSAANDELYKQAQGDLLDAQIAMQDAIIETSDREAELQRLRDGSLERDVIKAQDDLSDAYRDQADALADVGEALAVINGETFTDKDRAQLIADSLRGLVDSNPELQGVIDLLDEIEAGTSGGDIPLDFGVSANVDTSGLEGALQSAQESGAGFGTDWMSLFVSSAFVAMAGVQIGQAFGVTAGMAAAGGAVVAAGIALFALRDALNTAAERENTDWAGVADIVWDNIWDTIADGGRAPLTAEGNRFQNQLMAGLERLGVGTWESEDSFDWGFDEAWNNFLTNFGTGLGEVPQAVKDGFYRFGQNIASTLRLVAAETINFDIMGFLFRDNGEVAMPGEVLTNVKEAGSDFIGGFIQGAGERLVAASEEVAGWWTSFVNWVKEALGINSPSTVAKEIGKFFIQGFIDGSSEKLTEMLGWVTSWPQSIKDNFGEAGDVLFAKGHSLVGGLYNGATDRWDDLKTWFEGLPERAKNAISDVLGVGENNPLFQVGIEIISGLWEGITDRWDGLLEDWAWLVDKLPEKVKEILGIASPSKVFMGLGSNIAEGLSIGITEGMKSTQKNFEESVAGINGKAIEDNLNSFGIDAFDVAAFTGANASVSYLPPVVAGGGGNMPETVVERTEPHYHLEAITDASPDDIFARFGWGEQINTRGARR